jgi:hypothetical protein
MSWKSQIKLLSQQSMAVVYRPDEIYTFVGANVLFNIVGGPVWIHGLFAVLADDLDAGAGGGTANFTINGVAVDNGPVAVAGGALGDLLLCPLDDTATGAVIVNVPALCLPDPATLLVGGGKILATDVPGEITLVVGTAAFDGACAFYCIYQKMAPQSLVVVA